jgi:hypothetical protein
MSVRRAVAAGLGLVVVVAAIVGLVPHHVHVTYTINGQSVTLPPSLPCGSAFVPKKLPTEVTTSDAAISQETVDEIFGHLRAECASALTPPRWTGLSLLGLAVVLAVLYFRVPPPRPAAPADPHRTELPESHLRAPEDRSSGQPASAPAAPMASMSLADELRKLAALRDEGIITPDDFHAAKARLVPGS